MPARVTRKQAAQLGLNLDGGEAERKADRKRATPMPYHTQCVMCGEHFRTRASEDRHLNETRHPRYALVLAVD